MFRDAARSDAFVLDHWDALRITYEWRGRPECEVIGVPGGASEGFLSESTADAPAQHRPSGIEGVRSVIKRWIRSVLHSALSAHRQIDWAAILACPACRADVTITAGEVRCSGCRRRYPLERGVPIMLVDQTRMPIAAGLEPPATERLAAFGKASPR